MTPGKHIILCCQLGLGIALVSGCQSLNTKTKSTAIIFASDAPTSLPQVKQMLSETLLKNRDAEYAISLENNWHTKSAEAHNSSRKASIALSNKGYALRKRYQNDRRRRRRSRKSSNLAWKYYKEARNTLMTTFDEVPAYTDLLFWASVNLRHNKKRFRQVAPLYSATTSTRKATQLEKSAIVPLSTIQSIYMAGNRLVNLELKGDPECKIFVNGRAIKGFKTKIPRNVTSIVTANCGYRGNWSRSIAPKNNTLLNISPESYYVFSSMPNPLFLTKEDIKSLNPWTKKIVFVYYSGEANTFLFKGFDVDTMSSTQYEVLAASPQPSQSVFYPKVSGFMDSFQTKPTTVQKTPQERVNVMLSH